MSAQIRVSRANLRNLVRFLSDADLEQARLEQEFMSESNPTSSILYEMQHYIQDALFWDTHRNDCEWADFKKSAIHNALSICAQVRSHAVYIRD